MSVNNTITLRPGYLVNVSTSIKGGFKYTSEDVSEKEREVPLDDGVTVVEVDKVWKGRKVTDDKAEAKAAEELRTKVRGLVMKFTIGSMFPICPDKDKGKLDEAIETASKMVDDFNRTSRKAKIQFNYFVAKAAENDVKAAEQIGRGIKDLLDEMRAGLAEANIDRIREAATRATKMKTMLDAEAEAKVSAAIKGAREAATRMLKDIASGAERAAVAVKELKAVEDARGRFAFIDVEEAKAVEALPAAPPRALEVEEAGGPEAPPTSAPAGGPEAIGEPSDEYATDREMAAAPSGGRALDV